MPTDPPDDFNLREQIARIDRSLAETQKFGAEQSKLSAEAAKLTRDMRLSPYVLAASVTGGLVVALVSHFWR